LRLRRIARSRRRREDRLPGVSFLYITSPKPSATSRRQAGGNRGRLRFDRGSQPSPKAGATMKCRSHKTHRP